MALIGYARVSTQKQDLTEQIEQLKSAGCKKIFEGKNSGKRENNATRLSELLSYIREGDTVIVTKLDRLGRSLSQVLSVLDEFQSRKIAFKTLDGAIDTTKRNDPIAIAMIQLLGLFSELERNFIVLRTQEGKLAKGKAGIGGRPPKLTEAQMRKFTKDDANGASLTKLQNDYNISMSTVCRLRRKIRSRNILMNK